MDDLPEGGKCEYDGRIDASALPTPYLCGQVAHTSANCRRFLVSTTFGTAQLCEWHGRCVAGSVVDCDIGTPTPPPPYPPYRAPGPPATRMSDVIALAHSENASKLELVGAFSDSVRSHVKTSLHEVNTAVQRSALVVAQRTGLPALVVYAVIASQGFLFFALAFYLLVLKPRWRRLELLREEQIQETVEMLEYDRETPNVEKRFPRRMGRPGAPKYGALPTPRSLRPAHPALEHFERPQL